MRFELIIIGALALAGLSVLSWWLLVTTEGVYLGRRVVIWLYDRYAERYDTIKQFEPHFEYYFLASPILGEIAPQTDPLVLDIATGTGRLPLALCDHPIFTGQVIGIDRSRRMLDQAVIKLTQDELGFDRECFDLIWGDAAQLPFESETFDVVTCLESLEFMPEPQAALGEAVRVLRPGGLLLVTNRIGRHLMPGRTWDEEQITALLVAAGIALVQSEPWQVDYQKIWAVKGGSSDPIGPTPLAQLIHCPACDQVALDVGDSAWTCANCGQTVRMADDGVLELQNS